MRALLFVGAVLVVCWLLWCRFLAQDTQAPGSRLVVTPAASAAARAEPPSSRPPAVAGRGVVAGGAGADWRRFRGAHPRLALSAEVALTWVLGQPSPIRDIARSCGSDADLAAMALSAAVEIEGREMFVERIECDGGADEFCRCFVARLAQVSHVVLPDELPDDELVTYRGPLTLESLHVD